MDVVSYSFGRFVDRRLQPDERDDIRCRHYAHRRGSHQQRFAHEDARSCAREFIDPTWNDAGGVEMLDGGVFNSERR